MLEMKTIPLRNRSIKLGLQTFHRVPLEAPFERARQLGFDSVDVFFDKVEGHGFYPDDILPPTRDKIKRAGLDISVHAPIVDFGSGSWTRTIEKTILFCMDTNSRIMTMHPPIKEPRKVFLDLVRICAPFAQSTTFSFENTADLEGPKALNAFVSDFSDYTGQKSGITFDTGHANFNPMGPAAFLRKISRPVHLLHLHDNNGLSDAHLSPGNGNINFAEVFQVLEDIEFDGKGILEYWRPDEFERDAVFLLNAGIS